MTKESPKKSKSEKKDKSASKKKPTGKAVKKKEPVEVIDQALVDKSIKFINEKANESVYKGSIEIGEYILKNLAHEASCVTPQRTRRNCAVTTLILCAHS